MKILGAIILVLVLAGAGYGAYYYWPKAGEPVAFIEDVSIPEGVEADTADNPAEASEPAKNNQTGGATIQCPNRSWDCLIQAASQGSKAVMVGGGGIDFTPLFGMQFYGSTRYAIDKVAANGDLTFSTQVLSASVSMSAEMRQQILNQGGTQADIDNTLNTVRAEQQKMIGAVQQGIFSKSVLLKTLNNWKSGSFSTDDWRPHTVLRDDYQTMSDQEALAEGCKTLGDGAYFCPAMDGVTVEPLP